MPLLTKKLTATDYQRININNNPDNLSKSDTLERELSLP